jgi:regulator of protease activity HflC (stomatin/prohibitin superfamily)
MAEPASKIKVYSLNPIEILLFDESMWFLRLSLIIVAIFGWSLVGVLLELQNIQSLGVFFWQAFRYSLVPLAAVTGAVMLGASYVQDIYELKNYRQALQYTWASTFNGRNMGLVPAMLAGLSVTIVVGGFLLYFLFRINNQSPYLDMLISLYLSMFLGLVVGALYVKSFLPTLNIADGQKKLEKDEVNLLDVIGGPGWLMIEPGNVVVLERLESPAQVLDAGVHFIHRPQRIKAIISLKDQQAQPPPLNAYTKDGIQVTVKDFQFRYRLYAGRKHDGILKRTRWNPYPFSVHAARNLTYGRAVGFDGKLLSWEKAVQNAIDGAITGYINQNPLNKVLGPLSASQEARAKIEEKINSSATRTNLKNTGAAELLWYDIGRFEVSGEVDAERQKAWSAKLDSKNAIVRAQGEAELISTEERGRSESQVTILTGIIQALRDAGLPDEIDDNLWNIVLARTAQIIETLMAKSK